MQGMALLTCCILCFSVSFLNFLSNILFLNVIISTFAYLCYFSEERVRNRVQRIFKIWEERDVYNSYFVQELTALLDPPPNIEVKCAVKLCSDFEVIYFQDLLSAIFVPLS